MAGIIASELVARKVSGIVCASGKSRNCANVLGVAVDALNLERALSEIEKLMRNGPKGYVCAVSVHGVLEARKSEAVAAALANAAIALPDGTPTVWVGRAQGHRAMNHVTGPTVMKEIFRHAEFVGYTHFLYGGKPGIANELAEKLQSEFPKNRIVGTHTPPFRELTEEEVAKVVVKINEAKPDIVWVGISTPRQDLWMQRMRHQLNARLMFGVGAAFDILSGHIHPCPEWMKLCGLNWLHRLVQDPVRLWRRNLNNTLFLWLIALQYLGFLKPQLAQVDCQNDELN